MLRNKSILPDLWYINLGAVMAAIIYRVAPPNSSARLNPSLD